MDATVPSRDELGDRYLSSLQVEPYPVQEEALLAWMTAEQGVLVCAPTGTGKTMIAHAALYEALHRDEIAYYTTPLIALTDQKFHELQQCAVSWGFSETDVGLVTGNRRVNPDARVLVVVAEILLNRLLNAENFDFERVSAVVMDEFHNFADAERGIVWELSLALLPPHVRLMLLSATVGNSREFVNWLERCHNRKLELVEGTERRVPLAHQWIPDRLLGEHMVDMAGGEGDSRRTPALVFCFNREECWSVAEHLKGLDLTTGPQRQRIKEEMERFDFTQGAGPKIRQILGRGVGVHHAGMLPRFRRLVERLYEQKLLSVCVCTETLAAGINLPARSVVLTNLLKGPKGKKKLIDASTAHQIFGRAGRPQYDDRGYVYALAHEDDVKILRWQEKYDSIPENTKDPGLLKAKKALKKKKPTRRDTQQYWNEAQFDKLIAAPPGKLYSKGPLPWRLLAYLLRKSPEVERVRGVIRKRLLDQPRIEAAEKDLDRMLLSLWAGGFVTLTPEPPKQEEVVEKEEKKKPEAPTGSGMFDGILTNVTKEKPKDEKVEAKPRYSPELATPTPKLGSLLQFRGIHPIYGAFLLEHLGIADRDERIQAFESVLGLPRALWRSVRVPLKEEVPPGPLQTTRLDTELIKRGLMLAKVPDEEKENDNGYDDEEEFEPPLAEKLRLLFDATYPDVKDVQTSPVWSVGELLRFNGDFNKYIRAHNLVKQEGIIFRHLLRMILLCGEFVNVCPSETTPEEWRAEMIDISQKLIESCRSVDPDSTEKAIEQAHAADVVEGEEHRVPTNSEGGTSDADDERRWEETFENLYGGEK
ncbi:ski2-like helicase [Planctomycetes bacterium Pan216]|uniref:Ski2-like helicase n=1 Tax=Kolteria novifilia TaxID=2527975 RepID=A0A518B2Z8_9BACT|nr:ski2-like helicase [Planctomycetes bacterium Pan216]